MNMSGYYSGYITRGGTFIEIPETEEASDHMAYCNDLGVREDELMYEEGYVKLSKVLYKKYIYHGMTRLTPEQVRTLEELGYEVWEDDKV